MNLENFPCEVWYAHRKLFHRFVKYKKYIIKANASVPDLKEGPLNEAKKEALEPPVIPPPASQHVISLLTDSDGEVSDDSTTEVDVDALFNSDDGEDDTKEKA